MQLVIQIGGFDNSTIVAQAILRGLRDNQSLFATISRQLGDWTKIQFESVQKITWVNLEATRILIDPRDIEDQKDKPVGTIRIISDLGQINDHVVNAVRCAVPGDHEIVLCDVRHSSARDFFSTPPRTGVPFYPKPTTLLIATPPQAFHHED
jgi:hypothetical protein